MSGTSSFGTRQGGLTQSYKTRPAARRQAPTAPPPQQVQPTGQPAQPWGQTSAGAGGIDLYALEHPVGLRFVSGFIDLTILGFLTFFLGKVFVAMGGTFNTGATTSEELIAQNLNFTLLLSGLWFVYGLLFESTSWQGTPGKKLTGQVITDMNGERIGFGRALGRAFAKVFSSCLPLYVPYIMVGFTNRKQSLHDMMCGTLVFRASDLQRSHSVFD